MSPAGRRNALPLTFVTVAVLVLLATDPAVAGPGGFIKQATGKIVKGDKTLGDSRTIWSFVREADRWVLSNIDSAEMEMEYLREPSRVIVHPAKRPV